MVSQSFIIIVKFLTFVVLCLWMILVIVLISHYFLQEEDAHSRIQAILDQAEQNGDTEVCLPEGVHHLSKPLRLPNGMTVRGPESGTARLQLEGSTAWLEMFSQSTVVKTGDMPSPIEWFE